MRWPKRAGGIYGTAKRDTIIEDCRMQNAVSVSVGTPWGVTGGGAALPPRRTTIRDVVFQSLPGPVGGGGQHTVSLDFAAQGTHTNIMQLDEVYIENYQGTGRNLRLFYQQQHPTAYIIPKTGSVEGLAVGARESGLNNTLHFAQFGEAVAGAIARCADNSLAPEVNGYACEMTAQEFNGLPRAPADPENPELQPPRNLRITGTDY